MALEDTITNLGTAIINLVKVRITKSFTAYDAELEETLLELKAKIDELAENNSGNETSPVVTENSVVYDETLGKDKVILTKEYLNKYIPDVTFTEDLEIWVISSGKMSVNFGTNGAHYSVSGQESNTVDETLVSIPDSGACLIFWNKSTYKVDVVNSSTLTDSDNWIGLLLVDGLDTTDREGTDLGAESLSIGGL